ncbi:putative membrane protein [Bacteroides fragilis str. 3719 A10]|uniref:Putative membrane protein n=2 Tax=Bacteroides fragilis TaxID=817 RepID=A0A015SV22_BACFG|nr:putative membrane protein [Bacteroides fragilis str. 2-F-2 \
MPATIILDCFIMIIYSEILGFISGLNYTYTGLNGKDTD